MADTVYILDDGIKANLDSFTGKSVTSIGGGTLRLYQNNLALDHTAVIGSFTQCTFTGYAGIALTAATWAAAAVTAHVASSTYGATVTFTRSATGAGQLVYGWYLTDAGATKAYAAAAFAAGPYTVTTAGDAIGVVPTLTDQSLN